MSLKKHFIFIPLLLHCLLVNAQISESKSFTLSWNDESSIQLNKDTFIVLPLVEDNLFDEYNIPQSTHIFNVQNNTIVQEYQIKNVKFSTLSLSALKNIRIDKIPTEIKSEFQVTKVKNNSVAILQISPLVNQNGRIQKIISFTLDYALNAKGTGADENKNIAPGIPIVLYWQMDHGTNLG